FVVVDNTKVNTGLLLSLETGIRGLHPISVPKSNLADELSTLVNDRDVSDLIFELKNGQHFYAHKAILRIRSPFLYKTCKSLHMDDMVDLQQMILYLEEKRQK